MRFFYTKNFIRTFFITLSFLTGSLYACAQTVAINSSFTQATCEDSTVSIPYTVSGTFISGNVFIFELSDETGSFASPTVIATDTSIASRSVSWHIPTTLTLGLDYRIRIKSTSPAYTSASDSISIWIAPPFTNANSNSPVCAGDSLLLTATSDPVAFYSWSGPAGFSSTQQNPKIYSVDTSYKGVYKVYASLYGCRSRLDSVFVNVRQIIPSVSITPGPTDTICAGTTVNFTASPVNGGLTPSYTWQKNSLTVSSGSGYYSSSTLSNNDTIKVIMISSVACANPKVVSYKTVMLVKPIPAKSIASSNSPVCNTDAISLRATTSSSGSTYQWTGPAGFSSTLQNPTISSADSLKAGAYIVTAILNGCISPADTDTVIVVPSVTPAVSLSFSPSDTICKGQTLTFTANPVNGGTAPVYKWYRNGTFIPSITGNTYAIDTLADGDGIICILNSSATCPRPATVSYSTTVTVKPLPAIISILSNSPLCSSDTIKLNAVASIPAAGFTWTGPKGFTSAIANPMIAPIDSSYSGTYTARAGLNGCISAPANVSVLVTNDITPTVSISVYPGTLLFPNGLATFTATATNAGSTPVFQWKKNGFDIPGATGTIYTTGNLRNNDSITVVLFSSMTCANPAILVSNSITMHVAKPITLTNNLTLFPNPTNGSFVIKGIDTTGTQIAVSVFSLIGQLVYNKTTDISGRLFYQEVDLGGVADGVYIVHIKTDAEEKITRITVQH